LEAVTLTSLAWLDLCHGRPAPRVVELAERAMQWVRPETFDPAGFLLPACCLAFAGRLDRAEELLARGREAARRQGSPVAIASLAAMSGFCAYRRGALLEGESHLETAKQFESLVPFYAPVIAAYAAFIGFEREAPPEDLADPDLEYSDFDGLQVYLARGRIRQAEGELEAALSDYRACDHSDEPVWASGNPAVIPWRGAAVSVLFALGDEREARALADDEVERARAFGEPAALGRALHATARGDIERLRAAVEQLEQGQMRLVHADALVDLGSALRAAGDRTAARERLREGLRLAMSCGATRVIRRARDELGAAGARVRADGADRIETLTAAERRVAQLAAEGCGNREIAELLFVTEKTVETHLAHTYRKLRIRSRRALPELMGS
jgi:DNA-binding CsgD family transcriptional regulator